MSNVPVTSSSGFKPIRRAMPLAIGLCMGIFAAQAQAAVLLSDNFESGYSSNWTTNNAGDEWAVGGENGNIFFGRNTSSSTWSDTYGATSYSGDVAVEAWVRLNNWNSNSQNRVYLMARVGGDVTSTQTLTGYLVSISPDSTISIEKRGANKSMTTLAVGHGQNVLGADWYVGNWSKIRIEVTGTSTSTISIYVNNVQVATATDTSSPYTSGRVGFGGAGADADFDDVEVSNTTRGKESYSFLKPTSPNTPSRHIAAKPAVILASARSSKAGV